MKACNPLVFWAWCLCVFDTGLSSIGPLMGHLGCGLASHLSGPVLPVFSINQNNMPEGYSLMIRTLHSEPARHFATSPWLFWPHSS